LLTNSHKYCTHVTAAMLVFRFTPRPAEVPA
jgi:hypothetical protein